MGAPEKSAGISKTQDKKIILVGGGGMIRPLEWWKALEKDNYLLKQTQRIS